MTNEFTVGLGQMNSRDNIAENLKTIEKMTEEMAAQGANLVIFPEYSTFYSDDDTVDVSETLDGPTITQLSKIAQRYGVYLHNGSFQERVESDGCCYDTSVCLNPRGEIEAIYRKIHLFDVHIPGKIAYQESKKFHRGNEIVTLKNPLTTFGFTLCYDMRFPELFRLLTLQGAKVIFVPAAYTLYTGKDHWESILRTRAIENQIYIVAAAQFGKFPTHEEMSFGNSMVIDPWGTVLARGSERPCTLTAKIDLNFLEEVREKIPSLKNRLDPSLLTPSSRVANKPLETVSKKS